MPDELQNPTTLENRVSFLETKINELEMRLSLIESPATALTPKEPSQSADVSNNQISILLLSKNFHVANYNVGDSGDRIDFSLQFTNHLKKDVRAFTGVVIFKDLFERDILKVGLTDESGIQSGGKIQWKGGIEYNQFIDEHNRLLNIKENDLIVEFLLDRVIYIDGTKDVFGE